MNRVKSWVRTFLEACLPLCTGAAIAVFGIWPEAAAKFVAVMVLTLTGSATMIISHQNGPRTDGEAMHTAVYLGLIGAGAATLYINQLYYSFPQKVGGTFCLAAGCSFLLLEAGVKLYTKFEESMHSRYYRKRRR